MDNTSAVASLEQRNDILTVKCDEPDGEVIRHVRLCLLSFEKLKFFWQQLKDFDVLFNDFIQGDFSSFMHHFVAEINGVPSPVGLIWEVDDVGLFVLTDIRPAESATGHFVFWDRRFRGREELCKEMLNYVFNKYKFRRIQTEIPLYATMTMYAANRIGFTLEGRMRKKILYKDQWFDMNMYSVLPEDLKDERTGKKIAVVCSSCGEKHILKRKRGGVKHGTQN